MTRGSRGPVGVALVGVGGIASSHLAALRRDPGARIVAIVDAVAARAEEAAAAHGCRAATDLDDVLAMADVDAVLVCTPNDTHEELGLRVLASGRHLFVEKPLALDGAAARRLAAAAEERGLALAVGHSHRFSDQARAVRAAVESGSIGTPRSVRIVMNGGWIWPGWGAWVLDPERSGGHALHNGVHLTDLASWWMGERPSWVFARGQRATSAALAIHDYLVIQLGFPSGGSAVCEVSRAERPRSSSFLELAVVGSDGVVRREAHAAGVVERTESGTSAPAEPGAGDLMFVRQMEAFLAAVAGERDGIPPVGDAIAAVDVAVAAELSLATGERIPLGLS